MQTLYISRQGCYVSLQQEMLVVRYRDTVQTTVQLPLLEMVLVFGKSQLTTQALRACLWRDIPVAYLSRMGYCYGRVLPIERGYRQLARYQQQLDFTERLIAARNLVRVKLLNTRVLLLRQRQRQTSSTLEAAIQNLQYLAQQAKRTDNLDKLMGLEGAGAAQYFSVFGECLPKSSGFVFAGRSRRPPGNPVNAMLSFGYQVLWNHLLTLIELQGLDPYHACLHQGSERHAALASDLVEAFRAPLIDSLVLYVASRRLLDPGDDFFYRDGGCFLNETGRPKFLRAFLQRMEETVSTNNGEVQPKWDILNQEVKAYKQFVYNPIQGFDPYRVR